MGGWLLALALLPGLAAGETRRETWPDGAPRAEYEVELKGGREVRSGPYRAWHEGGSLASEGTFAEDRETGRWRFYHVDGKPAAEGSFARGERVGLWETFHPDGTRASRGRYDKGRRAEAWSFWRADGSPDPLDSGVYTWTELVLPDGRTLRGERVDDQLHGEWRSTWPNGAPQFVGRFVRGRRDGPWLLHAPDGLVATLLSRTYADDRAVGPATGEEPAAAEPLVIEAGRLGALADPRALDRELEAWLGAATREEQRKLELLASWVTAGTRALPVVLRRLLACDPASEAGRAALARLEGRLLRGLCNGHGLGLAAPGDEAAARALQRAWATLWAATADDAWFWRVELPLTPLAAPDELLLERPFLHVFAPVLAARTLPALYARRFEPRDRKAEAPVAAALEWLEANQLPDGSWSQGLESARRFEAHDAAITGLALLALLGGGRMPADSPAVANGVAWLLAQQSETSGEIPAERRTHDWLYSHLIATYALGEALALQPSAAVQPAAQKAVDVIFAAQNPYAGWRYDVPPSGENDTSVTAWAVSALHAAREAGLEGDFAAALEGARNWVEQATDATLGRVGYSALGELSSRTPENERFPREAGEAMTAAGLLVRRLCGVPADELMAKKQLELLRSRPPLWDVPGRTVDEYYFYYGAQAIALCDSPAQKVWAKALEGVARAQSGNRGERGSWAPVGVWAQYGGRVYTTALLALALEASYRYALAEPDAAKGGRRK
ncbi:MAG TPA: hypothetical protein VF530_23335 [Planctomycetota bacterium]